MNSLLIQNGLKITIWKFIATCTHIQIKSLTFTSFPSKASRKFNNIYSNQLLLGGGKERTSIEIILIPSTQKQGW